LFSRQYEGRFLQALGNPDLDRRVMQARDGHRRPQFLRSVSLPIPDGRPEDEVNLVLGPVDESPWVPAFQIETASEGGGGEETGHRFKARAVRDERVNGERGAKPRAPKKHGAWGGGERFSFLADAMKPWRLRALRRAGIGSTPPQVS
jgi:hypothetical protein